MQSRKRFLELLNKHIDNSLSPQEHDELFKLIASGQYDDLLHQHFESGIQQKEIAGADLPPYRAQEILMKVLNSEKHTSKIIPVLIRKKKIVRWSIAASIIGLLSIATYFWLTQDALKPAVAYTKHFTDHMVEKQNDTDIPLRLQLEDSSFVTLQPGAKITYPSQFSAGKRELFMEGEVFFEIKKHAGRPFFVYNNNIITHVLGTTFNIKMDEAKKLVEVSVVSGRVQVYENINVSTSASSKKNKAVILTPNQKVIYKEEDKQFTATLVGNPLPVSDEINKSQAQSESFVFEESPLSAVLESLEKTYQIEIVIQNDGIYNCLFTGDVTKYDLYTKLDIICESVKSSYEINGTKILIKGQGCY